MQFTVVLSAYLGVTLSGWDPAGLELDEGEGELRQLETLAPAHTRTNSAKDERGR
eukprot:COSAG06_NODE_39353_length_413_cov_1.748408_1_plen_55_part_00